MDPDVHRNATIDRVSPPRQRDVDLPPTLIASEKAAIHEFAAEARACLGPELHEMRLFGSRARGEGHADSDIDLALIVGPAGRVMRHRIYDLAFDVGPRHGVELAPVVFEEARFQELTDRERLIARDIIEQGIVL
jgi:predicted nucleotidyltransferase